jgi:DDE superfamily endonuclease
MFILRRVDMRELMEDGNPVPDAFNRRHAERRIQVKWGIGGMKSRFRKFLTAPTSRRSRFRSYFEACCRLTSFLHRRKMDFAITDDREYEQMPQQEQGFAAGWAD